MTTEDVLKGEESQIRVWCALLDGWFFTGEENQWSYRGEYCGYSKQDFPRFTTSLDAIRPLELATNEKNATRYKNCLRVAVSGDVPDNEAWLAFPELCVDEPEWWDAMIGWVTADAITRARAVCIAQLDRLNELLKGEPAVAQLMEGEE